MYKYFATGLVAVIIAGCGGGGGSSAPTPTTSSGTTPSTVSTAQVKCTNTDTAEYPAIFNGPWPTPTPADTIDPRVVRSLAFKDYYAGMFSANGKNCTRTEYAKLMYSITLDRMQKLHITRAWLYNWAYWDDAGANNLVTSRASWEIPEEVVTYIVTEARKRGIEIYLSWQFPVQEPSGKLAFTPTQVATQDTMRKIMDAHHKVMVDVAKYAESVGIAGVGLDWAAFTLRDMHLYRTYMDQRFSELADEMRKVYRGKLVYGLNVNVPYNEQLFNKVDLLVISVDPKLYNIENINMSVENVEAAVNRNLQSLYQANNYNKLNGKPVIIRIFAQSRDKFFTEGWVEDGFCVSGTTTSGNSHSCIQETYTTDFSVQAVGIEGMMRALDRQTLYNMESVSIEAYWLSDTLVPDTATVRKEGFPNISQSIRGKPAEKIVEYWYRK